LTLSEIAGPVLASIAVVLSVIVFKRTVDYQAYKDVDSDYREVLKIGLDPQTSGIQNGHPNTQRRTQKKNLVMNNMHL
jgi:hypothetical protein